MTKTYTRLKRTYMIQEHQLAYIIGIVRPWVHNWSPQRAYRCDPCFVIRHYIDTHDHMSQFH